MSGHRWSFDSNDIPEDSYRDPDSYRRRYDDDYDPYDDYEPWGWNDGVPVLDWCECSHSERCKCYECRGLRKDKNKENWFNKRYDVQWSIYKNLKDIRPYVPFDKWTSADAYELENMTDLQIRKRVFLSTGLYKDMNHDMTLKRTLKLMTIVMVALIEKHKSIRRSIKRSYKRKYGAQVVAPFDTYYVDDIDDLKRLWYIKRIAETNLRLDTALLTTLRKIYEWHTQWSELKADIIAQALKPSRIERILEDHGFDGIDHM